MTELERLSRLAHAACQAAGEPVPALRLDLRSYPVVLRDGTPVFDASRMRPDQVEDVLEILTNIMGVGYRMDTYELTRSYMLAFGHTGVRIQDIIEHTLAARTSVQRALHRLEVAGEVTLTYEDTRGKKATRRIRYWSKAKPAPQYAVDEGGQTSSKEDRDYSRIRRERLTRQTARIIHHGTALAGLSCRCGQCRDALYRYELAEVESAARRRGETGLRAGYEFQYRQHRKGTT